MTDWKKKAKNERVRAREAEAAGRLGDAGEHEDNAEWIEHRLRQGDDPTAGFPNGIPE